MTFSFDDQINAFGISLRITPNTGGAGGTVDPVTAFNDTLTIDLTIIDPSPGAQTIFFGVIDHEPFSTLTFTTADGADRVFYDALSFGTASKVPAPATISIFGAGLAGLAFLRRRRKFGTPM